VMKRTDGRPYFAEELAVALRDAGAIAVEDGRARLVGGAAHAFGAAASLEAVLRERLDRLPSREQLVVKTASAIGHVFPDQMLVDIHPIDADRSIIPEALRHLMTTDVLRDVAPPPGGEHAFKHVTLQQVAYDTLLFEQRRELHRRAATWYEERHEDLRPLLPLLAHHWMGAEDAGRAIDYLERAAEEALRTFSNREAVGFLTEAQTVAARAGFAVAGHRAAKWERWIGEAQIGMARVGDARGHLLRALELRGVAPPASAVRIGGGLLAEIARHVVRGRRAAPVRPPEDAHAELDRFAASVYHSLSEVHFFQHDQLALLHSTFASLNAAQRTGAVRETVNGLGSVGYAAGLVGLRGVARRYRDRSLALAEEKGTLPVVAFAHQIAATLDNAIGDSDDAERSCTRAEEIFGRLGDRFRWESMKSIHGYTYLARGALREAATAFAAVLDSAGPEGAIQTRAWATAGTILATVPAAPLDPAWIERARALLGRDVAPAERLLLWGAIALAERDRDFDAAALAAATDGLEVLAVTPPVTSYTLWSTAAIADVLVGARPDSRAARAVALLGKAARALPAGAPRAALARAHLAAARGKRASATRAYRAAAAAAERLRMPYEHALALAGLGQRASAATIRNES
jgi:tetratricopeptide (TPR) repeat protein